ncbi:ribonuclease D [Hymenobacter lapidiphilus]|uniref:HRDC domain-containing protein n=1 Tax=Hymenobacter lapidiphilus TaxID=2608003 RepID=A0A7Y7PLG0_9BACT|nr:HRDC domain-containing protein [Hymenobacter lapidiphilus]NVO29887.1 HRDC domain-containing protein [Hymenobacter lapidiphilus]
MAKRRPLPTFTTIARQLVRAVILAYYLMPDIQFITDASAVAEAARNLHQSTRIALDLEFDDMRYRYGRHLALIQVFDGQTVYLIDPLELENEAEDLEPLWQVLRDPAITTIFHSCKSDILLLDELYGVHVRNIVDTSVQHTLLAEADNNISLGRLIQEELGLEVDKGEQKSNWLKRPLTEAQKQYAANDVLYLFELTDRLSAKLAALGRTAWAEQENEALEAVRYTRDERPYMRLAGKYRIQPVELPMFRDLFMLRDEVARHIDRPSYMIASNDRLAELTRLPVTSTGHLRNANGLHPELKRGTFADRLVALSQEDRAPEPPLPADRRGFPSRRRLSGAKAAEADAREALLTTLKTHLAADHSAIMANLVLSNRLINDIIEQGADQVLRPWQHQLLTETAQKHSLDFSKVAGPFEK